MFPIELPYLVQILHLIGIQILLALSLNITNGQTGQFSLGHAGFMAIGAYGSAKLTLIFEKDWVSALSFLPIPLAQDFFFLLVLILGGLFAALAGFLIGLPSLRLKGDYLAIVTLGFAEMIRVGIINIPSLGAATGLKGIPVRTDLVWILFFNVLTLFMLSNWIKSAKGKILWAIREDEIAAESLGIQTTRYKVLAFTISAFFAGIAGGLFAHFQNNIHPSSFGFMKSVEILVIVILGGSGSLAGSVLAAILLTLFSEGLRKFQTWRMMIYSVLLIAMMLLRPQGLLGNREWKIKNLRFFAKKN